MIINIKVVFQKCYKYISLPIDVIIVKPRQELNMNILILKEVILSTIPNKTGKSLYKFTMIDCNDHAFGIISNRMKIQMYGNNL